MEKLTWRHVGVLQTLLTGACGNNQLYEALSTSDDLERDLFEDAANGEPNLVGLIRVILEKGNNTSWGNERWRYKIKIRRMRGENARYAKELLLTPDALIVPWPLPFYDTSLGEYLEELIEKEIPDLSVGNSSKLVDFDPARHLCLSSIFTVIDMILIDDDSPEKQGLHPSEFVHNREIVRRYEKYTILNDERDWSEFELPDNLDILPVENELSIMNGLWYENGNWKWSIGMIYESNNVNYDIVRSRYRMLKCKQRNPESEWGKCQDMLDLGVENDSNKENLFEVHPCTAFDDKIRDRSKIPRWQRKMFRIRK